jgi:hypothetical protein
VTDVLSIGGGVAGQQAAINSPIIIIIRIYCGRHKSKSTFNLGLRILDELINTEPASAYASNPHELGHLLKCHVLVLVGELAIKSSLEREDIREYFRLSMKNTLPPDIRPPSG